MYEMGDDTPLNIDVESTVIANSPPVRVTVGIGTWWDRQGLVDVSTPIVSSVPRTVGVVSRISSASEIAKYWLDCCLSNHQRCRGDGTRFPKRILDVSGLDVFLVEDGRHAPYAALSYQARLDAAHPRLQ